MLKSIAIVLGCATLVASPLAAETITYTYDAKGRLVKVVRSGPVNKQTDYEHDKADNRVRVKTN